VTSYCPRTYFSSTQPQIAAKFLFAAVVTSAVIIYQLDKFINLVCEVFERFFETAKPLSAAEKL